MPFDEHGKFKRLRSQRKTKPLKSYRYMALTESGQMSLEIFVYPRSKVGLYPDEIGDLRNDESQKCV